VTAIALLYLIIGHNDQDRTAGTGESVGSRSKEKLRVGAIKGKGEMKEETVSKRE
jgi:hypothetical protein